MANDQTMAGQHVADHDAGSFALPLEEFGRYRIVRELGRGAMGAVYLAEDQQLGRNVALKIPAASATDISSETLQRFSLEARAAAAVQHPGLCPIFDVGEVDGQHYITMAYIDGQPLQELAKDSRWRSPATIVRLIRKIALAMAEAHRHDVVHRDLKPANIMVKSDGEPVVMDFGLALRSGKHESEERLTQWGTIIGTPAYMAPEQIDGNPRTTGIHADIYSLGVIFYELLAGRLPFEGSLVSILKQISTSTPPPPSEFRPGGDLTLQRLCLRMLAKETPGRPDSMLQVADELADWLDFGQRDSDAAAGSAVDQAIPRAVEGDSKDSIFQIRKRRGVLVALCLVAAAVLAATTFLLKTPNGTLKVTVFDPEIEVTVKGTGVVITGDGQPEIEVEAGHHMLHVSGRDFDFDTNRRLALKEGATVIVNVELLEDEVRVTGDGLFLGSAPRKHSAPIVATTADSRMTAEVSGTAATDNSGTAAKKSSPIDILSRLTPQFVLDGKVTKHSDKEWVFWKGGLLAFPAEVTGDYRLSIDFEHTAGPHGTLALLISIEGRFVEVIADTTDSQFGTTLRRVGSNKSDGAITHSSARPFKKFGRNLMHVNVHRESEKTRISVSIENRKFLETSVESGDLSSELPHAEMGTDEMAIKCGSEAIFVIREIQLETLTTRVD